MKRLVEQAQDAVRAVVKLGETVIDATAGGGRDTLFLAQLVGETGAVHAFDVQGAAIAETQWRLDQAGVTNVTLHNRTHAKVLEVLPAELVGQVAAVMFNLGYLPGGDQQLVTQIDSTLAALRAAVTLLQPGGILSVLAYRGHAGGVEEVLAVQAWMESCAELTTPKILQGATNDSPVLVVANRQSQQSLAEGQPVTVA
jgi:predicted methyltransferase